MMDVYTANMWLVPPKSIYANIIAKYGEGGRRREEGGLKRGERREGRERGEGVYSQHVDWKSIYANIIDKYGGKREEGGRRKEGG
jgi:hypothetical protein